MNNMHKYIVKLNKRLLINLALILSIIFSLSCVDGASDKQVVTVNPFGVGIIVFNSIPLQLFGNGTDIDTIKVNTGLIPDGSTITARITGTDIERELAGCVVSASATVEMGMAIFDFLSPILPGNLGETRFVNLAVIIETPDGTEIRDFVTVLINAVGIIPPEDTTVDAPSEDSPVATFLDLEFSTFGFDPGTIAECMVSNPGLGSLQSDQVPVRGSKQTGRLIVKYFPTPSTCGGNQIVTCMITMPNPDDINSVCEDVPEDDRKVSAEVLIVQGCADDILNPPAPNSMTCTPNPVTGGTSGTCTCNNTNAAGETINFTGSANIDFPVGMAVADVNGTAVVTFVASDVDETVTEQVTCGPDASPNFAQTSITINPAPAVAATNLSCVPNPANSGDTLVCTCTTNQEEIVSVCFERLDVPGDPITSVTFPASPMNCVDSDSNGTGIIFADTDTDELDNDILQCCVDTEADDDCDNEVVAQTTQVVNPPQPGDITVDLTALNTTVVPDPGPGHQTILTCTITGVPPGSDACFDITINESGSTPDPTVTPTCGVTDANGVVNATYTAGGDEGTDTIECCFDDDTSGGCDPGEISDFIEINVVAAAPPPPPSVTCTSNPGTVVPGNNSAITAIFANLPMGTDEACFNIVGQTVPASSLSTTCTTIVANGGSTIFMSNAGIVAPQNAFIACCAEPNGNTDGCFDMEGEIVGPFPALVQVNPTPPSPFAVTITQGVGESTNVGSGDMRSVEFATNPPVPMGTQFCLEFTFDNMTNAGTAEITSVQDAGNSPQMVGGTLCAMTTDASGTIIGDFGFMAGDAVVSGELATLTGCIDLTMNGACDGSDPIDTLSFTVP